MPPGKRCQQQVLPRQKMPPQILPRQKMPKATFSQPYMCTKETRTINLSDTQLRYQLIFFVCMYGYIWLAEGCLWHLLPRQNLPSASFAQEKHARRYVLLGCTGADPGGGPRGPGPPPLTTKNEAPAPKFYKTEAPEWQF